jgi:hypothetical protein
MHVKKTLIVRKTATKWQVIIRISSLVGCEDTKLAVFADRPMALAPMAAALEAFQKYLKPDDMVYQGTKAGYAKMRIMGIITDEVE